VTITEFIWPQDRIAQIAKHRIEPNEFEQVCFGQPLVQRVKRQARIRLTRFS